MLRAGKDVASSAPKCVCSGSPSVGSFFCGRFVPRDLNSPGENSEKSHVLLGSEMVNPDVVKSCGRDSLFGARHRHVCVTRINTWKWINVINDLTSTLRYHQIICTLLAKNLKWWPVVKHSLKFETEKLTRNNK